MNWRRILSIGFLGTYLAFNVGCGTIQSTVGALGRVEDKIYDGMRRGMDHVAEKGNKHLPKGLGNAEWGDYGKRYDNWKERKRVERLEKKVRED